ncbi:MAG: hypothetical protein ACOYLG_13095, partial [Chitinophagaceae bacterium]
IKTMADMSRELADQNRAQLKKGQTAKGTKFKPYASDNYASVKNRMNPIPGYGNPDLFVEGKFAAGIKLVVGLDGGDMGSTDGKEARLEGMYGADNIFGLNDESLGELKPEFSDKLVNNVKAYVGI